MIFIRELISALAADTGLVLKMLHTFHNVATCHIGIQLVNDTELF
jgi:hypothetical protein